MNIPKPSNLILYLLAFINAFLVLWRKLYLDWSVIQDISFSYIGDDYPLYYPMQPLDIVAMTLHETVRFNLNLSDPIADQEWKHVSEIPEGFGRLRLGPDYRVFLLTAYHEMHCLRQIQVGILTHDDPIANPHHIQHCFTYLRQLFLCKSAHSLEEGDFMKRNFESDRIGDSLVCRDWEALYDELDLNFERWNNWKKTWN